MHGKECILTIAAHPGAAVKSVRGTNRACHLLKRRV
jgi:hypothetical protein